MNIISWSNKYNVNIKQIDKQHQYFFSIINRLYNIVIEESTECTVEQILDELIDYTDYHFKTEEALLKAHDYPDFDNHKPIHDNYVKEVQQLHDDFIAGRVMITTTIITFLNDWLINHILGSDQKYAAYLNSKGVF